MMFGNGPDAPCGEDEARRIIGAFLDAGNNFIDTANVYTAGQSEQVVGRAIKGKRDSVVVATTTASRFAATARPTISSDWPPVYTLAVSMKLFPASRKASMTRRASASSHGAAASVPKFIAPRHASLTLRPELPRFENVVMRLV